MKKITKETYINWYKDMLFWRKFEDKLAALYIQQKVRGFLHLYNGQEAVLAGALHVMQKNDKMITAYRNHVQPIGLGVDPKRIMEAADVATMITAAASLSITAVVEDIVLRPQLGDL